jgi:hypothetical protein
MDRIVLLKNKKSDDMKAVKMGFSLFALFLTPIWAIAKKSWLALVIILIAIIINVACQMLLSSACPKTHIFIKLDTRTYRRADTF